MHYMERTQTLKKILGIIIVIVVILSIVVFLGASYAGLKELLMLLSINIPLIFVYIVIHIMQKDIEESLMYLNNNKKDVE